MSNFLADFILRDAECIADAVDLSDVRGKDILITGASGLIGQYMIGGLAQAALQGNTAKNVYLVVRGQVPDYFDRLCQGLPASIITTDLSDYASLSRLPACDIIVHASGYGQPGKFLADPVKTLQLNTLATFATLELLRPEGKYVFTSSSEVYSGLHDPPFREDTIGTTNTDHPRACYIEGKRVGEAITNAYRLKGVAAKSVRLSLAYGPGTRPNDARVINNFIKKAVCDGRIDMLDSGAAWRTYIYVTDAVELIFAVLFAGAAGIYNVGGTSRSTIRGLAENVGQRVGVPVNHPEGINSGLVGAPDDVFVDITRVREEFGKSSFVSLDEGLDRTIAWQRELYGAG